MLGECYTRYLIDPCGLNNVPSVWSGVLIDFCNYSPDLDTRVLKEMSILSGTLLKRMGLTLG